MAQVGYGALLDLPRHGNMQCEGAGQSYAFELLRSFQLLVVERLSRDLKQAMLATDVNNS